MSHFNLQQFPSDDALANAVASAWLDAVAARAGTRQLVALSGGRVARKLFAAVVEQAAARGADFSLVEFFWADERCVAPTDPESNYRLAQEGLIGPLEIAENRIHRIPGEDGPELASATAAAALRRVAEQPQPAVPALDLVLLGMGEDGHVASLFPGDEAALADHTAVFRPVKDAPKPPPCRVTLGLGPLLAAREVWVLAAGAGKAAALRDALSPQGRTPLARVIQQRAMTRIFSAVGAD
jgi:6-phosphogluconolactonase